MAFDWTSLEKNDRINAQHIEEIVENLGTFADNLGVDEYEWSSVITPLYGKVVKKDHIQELRDATDYMDGENYCQMHDSVYYSSHDDSENTSHDDGYNGTYDSGDNSSHRSSNNSTIRSTYYRSDNDSHDSSYDSGDNSFHRSSDNDSHRGNENGTHNDSNEATFYSSENETHRGSYDSSHDNSHDSSYDSGYNSSDDSSKNSGENTVYAGIAGHGAYRVERHDILTEFDKFTGEKIGKPDPEDYDIDEPCDGIECWKLGGRLSSGTYDCIVDSSNVWIIGSYSGRIYKLNRSNYDLKAVKYIGDLHHYCSMVSDGSYIYIDNPGKLIKIDKDLHNAEIVELAESDWEFSSNRTNSMALDYRYLYVHSDDNTVVKFDKDNLKMVDKSESIGSGSIMLHNSDLYIGANYILDKNDLSLKSESDRKGCLTATMDDNYVYGKDLRDFVVFDKQLRKIVETRSIVEPGGQSFGITRWDTEGYKIINITYDGMYLITNEEEPSNWIKLKGGGRMIKVRGQYGGMDRNF